MNVKKKIGTVVSDKMNNTRIVLTKEKIFHKKYKKVILATKRYSVHDNKAIAATGDQVMIYKTLRTSKTKNWILRTILKKFSK